MTSVTNEQLMQEALKAREKAHVPFSHFKVGAALLTKDGQVFHGCNIENSGYSATNCAERTAIFSAWAHDQREFVRLAVVADTRNPASPCGVCRQVISDLCPPDMEIILMNLNGDIEYTTPAQLLPGAFRPEDLNGQV